MQVTFKRLYEDLNTETLPAGAAAHNVTDTRKREEFAARCREEGIPLPRIVGFLAIRMSRAKFSGGWVRGVRPFSDKVGSLFTIKDGRSELYFDIKYGGETVKVQLHYKEVNKWHKFEIKKRETKAYGWQAHYERDLYSGIVSFYKELKKSGIE